MKISQKILFLKIKKSLKKNVSTHFFKASEIIKILIVLIKFWIFC